MVRYISLLLLIGLAWGQSDNPCEDERYLKLKKKSLEEMTDREYDYFKIKDSECSENKRHKEDLELLQQQQNVQPKVIVQESDWELYMCYTILLLSFLGLI